MSKESPYPVEISLHKKSRLLSLRFSDGASFELPCEYLRVFSTAAEVKADPAPVTGKENVNIEKIEPQGQYAIRPIFDDGHDTGIFSWKSLYDLGKNYPQNWQDYLARLKAVGYERNTDPSTERRIKILYFSWLVNKLGKQTEEMILPPSVTNIESLLKLLRVRKSDYAAMFEDKLIQTTVNKQFSESFTRLEDGDEVALIPTSPTPPATPNA